ncbi:MAG: hypothetical protein ABFD91_05655 [Anaerohalosphaeraceae bacterium]
MERILQKNSANTTRVANLHRQVRNEALPSNTGGQIADTQHLSIEIHHSFENLEPFRSNWDTLIEETSDSIFQSYDWCRIWWKYYGQERKMFIFLFRQEEQLVGILPMFAEKIWLGSIWLNTLKIFNCDNMYSASYPAIREVFVKDAFKLVFNYFKKNYHWDIMVMDSVPGILDSLVEKLQNSMEYILPNNFKIKSSKPKDRTYFFLPASYEQYIQSFNKKNNMNFEEKTVFWIKPLA